jgi:hypothetical protein
MSKTFPEKIDKNFDVSFSSTFCFIAFSGVSQRLELKQNTTKNVGNFKLAKKRVEKFLPKKSTKNPKPNFSRFPFITFLGVSR